jgi:anaerobic magnesium-protoporphyrin IX monomethyl ester cyclase
LKILLIYPYFFEDCHDDAEGDIRVVPVGLYYIGALLKDNQYDVEILNWYNVNKTPEKIEETLKKKQPSVIGFSIVNANRWGGIEIAQLAKRILPEVKIVFGGIGTTFLWKHLLTHFNQIDYAVLGEGEYSFLNLIQCIEKENFEEIDKIKGIAFRRGETVIKTNTAEMIQDIDRLPLPSKYFEFQFLISARGCPSNCTFCGSPKFWGRKVRFHSPEYFVEQLEQLYQKGITFFYISDDTFTMRSDRVIQICKKIIEKDLKITWYAISRVNYVNEEILYWMRKAGCIQISYGVESGSEKIRDTMNKNIKTEDIKSAFDLTIKYGIIARAYIIYGAPGENWKTIQETIDLIHQIRPLDAVFYILTIYPGTALYEDLKQKMNLDDDVWLERIEDIHYFRSDRQLSVDMILAFGQKLTSDFYTHLPEFADAIQLVDQKDLYESHADFLSRYASCFSPGTNSAFQAIPEKEEIAQKLYKRALSYHPNQIAYMGLASIKENEGNYEECVQIFSEGMKHFPESEVLAISLGISHIQLGRYVEALKYFQKFPNSHKALQCAASCYHMIGDYEKESSILRKLEKLSHSD